MTLAEVSVMLLVASCLLIFVPWLIGRLRLSKVPTCVHGIPDGAYCFDCQNKSLAQVFGQKCADLEVEVSRMRTAEVKLRNENYKLGEEVAAKEKFIWRVSGALQVWMLNDDKGPMLALYKEMNPDNGDIPELDNKEV